MIKIVPCTFYNEKLYTKVKKYYNSSNITKNNWWFFDGEIENIIKYDKGYFASLPDELTREMINWSVISGNIVKEVRNEQTHKMPYINGIYNVHVYGIKEPCIGFFWTSNERYVEYKSSKYLMYEQEGFVVLDSDIEAKIRAMKKFTEKL